MRGRGSLRRGSVRDYSGGQPGRGVEQVIVLNDEGTKVGLPSGRDVSACGCVRMAKFHDFLSARHGTVFFRIEACKDPTCFHSSVW
jgi:hypothetical protein